EAGLTLLAFLAEAAGERPPPAIADAAGLAARWDLVRQGWDGAPDLAGALARLPPHLAVGARAGREEVVAGLQLADGALAAGARIALERDGVAALARRVLAALGPAERCAACREEVLGRHLLRTRGLDERHGIACPRCGAILRSYWRYGEPEGLEALAPLALELGLVAEQPVALGDATLGFQLLPEEHAALTAAGLAGRFAELYLAPCEVALPEGALTVEGRGGHLGPRARVAGAGRLAFRLGEAAGTTEDGLVELLRARIERRFRPGG
ncbi:MAG TPA: molecular chaperone DnaJ, partial [Anaeromyxobacteraceae bacterium]|nr:molecular chaperone DnaJ [Anaeromyxobacteraceae bacterium]